MEHSLFVTDPEDLRLFDRSHFDRVYLGAESCHWLTPSPALVRGVVELCGAEGATFSLVIPVLPPAGLPRARALLDSLPVGAEVVLNDWGLLRDVRDRGLVPVLGRLLIKVKRDPRITPADLEDAELARYLRSSNLDESAFLAFLAECGISRVELDNVPQGWGLKLPSTMRSSLYYPWVYASTTWRCASLLGGAAARETGRCRSQCACLTIQAVTRRGDPAEGDAGRRYWCRGGQLYFRNDVQPGDTDGWNVDRLVFMPNPNAPWHSDIELGDWDAVYARAGAEVAWGHDEADPRLLDLVKRYSPVPSPRTLDLGCGNGRSAVPLRGAGCRLVGLDRSVSALRQARARCHDLPLVRADAIRLPFARHVFDLVVDDGCLHALSPSRQAVYAEAVVGALRPGGVYLVLVRKRADTRQWDAPVFFSEGVLPEWGFTPEQIRRLFAGSLELVESIPWEGRAGEAFWYFVLRRGGAEGR